MGGAEALGVGWVVQHGESDRPGHIEGTLVGCSRALRLGFRVSDLGFRVQGLRFRVWGFRVWHTHLHISDLHVNLGQLARDADNWGAPEFSLVTGSQERHLED